MMGIWIIGEFTDKETEKLLSLIIIMLLLFFLYYTFYMLC